MRMMHVSRKHSAIHVQSNTLFDYHPCGTLVGVQHEVIAKPLPIEMPLQHHTTHALVGPQLFQHTDWASKCVFLLLCSWKQCCEHFSANKHDTGNLGNHMRCTSQYQLQPWIGWSRAVCNWCRRCPQKGGQMLATHLGDNTDPNRSCCLVPCHNPNCGCGANAWICGPDKQQHPCEHNWKNIVLCQSWHADQMIDYRVHIQDWMDMTIDIYIYIHIYTIYTHLCKHMYIYMYRTITRCICPGIFVVCIYIYIHVYVYIYIYIYILLCYAYTFPVLEL